MKRVITFATVLAVIASAAPQARAYGLGVYLDGGGGSGDITVTAAPNRTHGSRNFGAGLALDTTLARDTALAGLPRDLLGYRLKVGYQRQDWNDGVLLNAGTLDAILGVGLWRRQSFRLWAGPLIRAQYLWGTEKATTPYYGFAGQHVMKSTLSAWGAGAGVALGANLPSLGLGVEAGYVYTWLFGSASGPQAMARSFDATEGHAYGSVVLMFR